MEKNTLLIADNVLMLGSPRNLNEGLMPTINLELLVGPTTFGGDEQT